MRRRALCLIGGAYGERFAGITEAVGRDVVRLNVPLGRTIEPEMLADALKRSAVDSVTVVHSETSTGALAPLEEIAAVVSEAKKAKEEGKEKTILFNWSGHGLMDLTGYDKFQSGELTDVEMSDQELAAGLAVLEGHPKPGC